MEMKAFKFIIYDLSLLSHFMNTYICPYHRVITICGLRQKISNLSHIKSLLTIKKVVM